MTPTFKIESLFDAQGEYVGIFNALTGELLHHEGKEDICETEQEQ